MLVAFVLLLLLLLLLEQVVPSHVVHVVHPLRRERAALRVRQAQPAGRGLRPGRRLRARVHGRALHRLRLLLPLLPLLPLLLLLLLLLLEQLLLILLLLPFLLPPAQW